MGRSLRRAKKTRPKVQVGVKKQNKLKRGIKPDLLRAPSAGRTLQLAQQCVRGSARSNSACPVGPPPGPRHPELSRALRRHGIAGDWVEEKTTQTNYQRLRLLHDPNAAFGRNASADVLGSRAAELEAQEEAPSDDPGDHFPWSSVQCRVCLQERTDAAKQLQ